VSLNYRAEVDGLRAIAVISVILYHAGFTYASGGFVGVDVFFVISGCLITSIIVKDLREESFSTRRFYERRVRRIIPALFFVSALCLVPAWLWMFPDEFAAFGKSLIGVATFSANVVFWLQTSYFSPSVGRLPLLHIWSLGVEEQYYLLAPLAIGWLWSHGYRRRLIIPIGLIGVASLALAEWGSRFYPSATFYLLHTRVWELMIGSGLAISGDGTSPSSNRWKANWLSVLGLLLILYSIVAFTDKTTRFP
jgi:peptidoglycan/LPS O-acetylase OafA/YrhL